MAYSFYDNAFTYCPWVELRMNGVSRNLGHFVITPHGPVAQGGGYWLRTTLTFPWGRSITYDLGTHGSNEWGIIQTNTTQLYDWKHHNGLTDWQMIYDKDIDYSNYRISCRIEMGAENGNISTGTWRINMRLGFRITHVMKFFLDAYTGNDDNSTHYRHGCNWLEPLKTVGKAIEYMEGSQALNSGGMEMVVIPTFLHKQTPNQTTIQKFIPDAIFPYKMGSFTADYKLTVDYPPGKSKTDYGMPSDIVSFGIAPWGHKGVPFEYSPYGTYRKRYNYLGSGDIDSWDNWQYGKIDGWYADETNFVTEDHILAGYVLDILIDQDILPPLYTGSSVILEGGWRINILEISVGSQPYSMWWTLTSGGAGGTIQAEGFSYEGDTIVYEHDLQHSGYFPTIIFHLEDIFKGTETNSVRLRGLVQVSHDEKYDYKQDYT